MICKMLASFRGSLVLEGQCASISWTQLFPKNGKLFTQGCFLRSSFPLNFCRSSLFFFADSSFRPFFFAETKQRLLFTSINDARKTLKRRRVHLLHCSKQWKTVAAYCTSSLVTCPSTKCAVRVIMSTWGGTCRQIQIYLQHKLTYRQE